jgi:holin-like protein
VIDDESRDEQVHPRGLPVAVVTAGMREVAMPLHTGGGGAHPGRPLHAPRQHRLEGRSLGPEGGPVLRGFAVLLLFQLLGEVVELVAGLPVPGPVIGMVLLLVALEAGMAGQDDLREASGAALAFLSLLFVPAGVGIIEHLPRLAQEWPALGASLVVSTAATVAVTGWLAERLTQRRRGDA